VPLLNEADAAGNTPLRLAYTLMPREPAAAGERRMAAVTLLLVGGAAPGEPVLTRQYPETDVAGANAGREMWYGRGRRPGAANAAVQEAQARLAAGTTPLHEAAAMGDVELMRALVAAGADVDAGDALGNTPLLYCLGYAPSCPSNHASHAPDNDAIIAGAVSYLLDEAHADGDAVNCAGEAKVHMAALGGRASHVKKWLGRNHLLAAKSSTNATTMHYAAASGHVPTVQAVLDARGTVRRPGRLDHIFPRAKAAASDFPLSTAVALGRCAVAGYLVSSFGEMIYRGRKGTRPRVYCVCLAATVGDAAMITALMDAGAPASLNGWREWNGCGGGVGRVG
jgi:ankyrin repeat protein